MRTVTRQQSCRSSRALQVQHTWLALCVSALVARGTAEITLCSCREELGLPAPDRSRKPASRAWHGVITRRLACLCCMTGFCVHRCTTSSILQTPSAPWASRELCHKQVVLLSSGCQQHPYIIQLFYWPTGWSTLAVGTPQRAVTFLRCCNTR